MTKHPVFVSLAWVIAFHAAGQEAPVDAFPQGDFPAAVVAVVPGDAVRVTVGDGDALAGLYGVSTMSRSRNEAAATRDFIRERTADATVTVRPVKTVAGMPYAEIVLPAGDVLNHLLLSEGHADLDLLTAADDAHYAALAGAGAAREAVETPVATPSARAPEPVELRAALADFRMRRQLRDTAAFEAGLEKWAAMPEEYREGVRQHYEQALEAAGADGAALLASLRAEVNARDRALRDTRAVIEERRAAIAAERERVLHDPSLQTNRRLYERFRADALADRIAGFPRSAHWNERFAERYRARAVVGQLQADAEYLARRRAHEDVLRSLTAEQRAHAEAVYRANTRLRAASIQASDRQARLLRTLVQFDLYDQALEEEMRPSLPMRTVAMVEGAESRQLESFRLDAPLGRVDWYADPQQPRAYFTGIIRSVEDDRPVARFRSSDPPHESYLLLDGPGEYYATIETSGPISYLVDVFAIDGN